MSGWRELDSEQSGKLDRTLDALRVSAAPAGLEERVLRGVQARVARGELGAARRGLWGGRSGRGGAGAGIFRGGDWLRRGWVVGGFVTAAVAFLLVVVGVREGRRPGLVERANAPAMKALKHGVVVRVGGGDSSVAARAGEARAALGINPAAGLQAAAQRAGLEREVHVRTEAAQRGGATPANAQVAAVWIGGMPAPPMPLTEQERLLLEVVRGRNAAGQAAAKAAALEMLDRRRQDEELARNNAEFLKFFPPPPPAPLPIPPPDAADGDGAGKVEKVIDAGQAVQQGAGQGSKQVENSGGKR